IRQLDVAAVNWQKQQPAHRLTLAGDYVEPTREHRSARAHCFVGRGAPPPGRARREIKPERTPVRFDRLNLSHDISRRSLATSLRFEIRPPCRLHACLERVESRPIHAAHDAKPDDAPVEKLSLALHEIGPLRGGNGVLRCEQGASTVDRLRCGMKPRIY